MPVVGGAAGVMGRAAWLLAGTFERHLGPRAGSHPCQPSVSSLFPGGLTIICHHSLVFAYEASSPGSWKSRITLGAGRQTLLSRARSAWEGFPRCTRLLSALKPPF